MRGRVLVPGDAGYDAARLIFNRRYDGVRPPAVVQVRDRADVQAVVRWADRFDVPLVARSGVMPTTARRPAGAPSSSTSGGLDGVAPADGVATIGPAPA